MSSTKNTKHDEPELGEVYANVYQIARMNSLLCQGFRFELAENIKEVNSTAKMLAGQKRSCATVDPAPKPTEKPAVPKKAKKEPTPHIPPTSKVQSKSPSKTKKPTQPSNPVQSKATTKTASSTTRKAQADGYSKIERVLNLLKKHTQGEKFMAPFSGAPSSDALDLTIIESKLKGRQYSNLHFFALDIRKMFNSIWKNSSPASEIYISATELCVYFEKIIKDMGNIQIESNPRANGSSKAPAKPASKSQSAEDSTKSSSKQTKDKPLTKEEKALLKVNIMKLPPDLIPGLLPIIRDEVDLSQTRDTLEFDIDVLPIKTCRQMEEFVRECQEKIASRRGGREENSRSVVSPPPKTDAEPSQSLRSLHISSPSGSLHSEKQETVETKKNILSKEEIIATTSHPAKECPNNFMESEGKETSIQYIESEDSLSSDIEHMGKGHNSKNQSTTELEERYGKETLAPDSLEFFPGEKK